MTSPALAMQNAMEATLRADAAVKAIFGGTTRLYIMDAPNDAPFPHVIIGECQEIGDDTECASVTDLAETIHVYARGAKPNDGRSEAKAIADAVRRALTVKLTIDGHVVDDWEFEGSRHFSDIDGLTAHSVVTINYQTTANAA